MPKMVTPLTDTQIKHAKAKEKTVRLFDGDGLFIEIQANGSKFWRFRFRQTDGRSKELSFGKYPEVTLVSARAKRLEARQLVANGIDPARRREEERQTLLAVEANTFEKLAREWHEVKTKSWSASYAKNVLHRLELDVFPAVGKIAINDITHRQMIDVLRKIEARGAHEIAKRERAVCAQVFGYAIQIGIGTRNPISEMRDILQRVTPSSFAAINPDELPDFLRALQTNEACMSPVTRIALRLMMLTFVRTSELIETPWNEIADGSDTWIIPWSRMKMGKRRLNPIKKDHLVPLSRQAQALLAQLRRVTGGSRYVFPNLWDHGRPMSNGAILKALERMGYKGEMTGHGFRALAMSTIKERLGYRHEVIDRQLAHVHKDKVQRAYDRAEFIAERRAMMQAWADYIDKLGG